jgi:hypothetical protein
MLKMPADFAAYPPNATPNRDETGAPNRVPAGTSREPRNRPRSNGRRSVTTLGGLFFFLIVCLGKIPSLARKSSSKTMCSNMDGRWVLHLGRVDFRNDRRIFGIKDEDGRDRFTGQTLN